MQKIMIACSFDVYTDALKEQLDKEYDLCVCKDGATLVQQLRLFSPDLLLLDMNLPGGNLYSFLRSVHISGKKIKIIALTCSVGERVVTSLKNSGVHVILPKPCTVTLAVSSIYRLLNWNPMYNDVVFCLENEVDDILLELGFRMGPLRYKFVFEAIIYRYLNPRSAMKEIYIEVGRICGGSSTGIEKAIRDSVEDAYKNSDGQVWDVIFPYYREKERPYPNNEDFIARVVNCVEQKHRKATINYQRV